MLALVSQKLKFWCYLRQVLLKLLYVLLYLHRGVGKFHLKSTDQLFFKLLLQCHLCLLNQCVHLLEGTIDHVIAKLKHASVLLKNLRLLSTTIVLINFLKRISVSQLAESFLDNPDFI